MDEEIRGGSGKTLGVRQAALEESVWLKADEEVGESVPRNSFSVEHWYWKKVGFHGGSGLNRLRLA